MTGAPFAYWSTSEDTPWFTTPWNEWPATGHSDSGLVYVVDRDPDGDACGERDEARLWVCYMPRGHDTPHLPATCELIAAAGPLVVRSVGRSPMMSPGVEVGKEAGRLSPAARLNRVLQREPRNARTTSLRGNVCTSKVGAEIGGPRDVSAPGDRGPDLQGGPSNG